MAALTPAQIELANSLTQDELPTKLRCAICSKLAVNAFRLPCCETAICENCQSTLPSSCPVCEHSPVSAADCTVYKSLRTTIRVFLKTEEKKREAARSKANGSALPTPVEATPTPALTQAPVEPPPAAESSSDPKDDTNTSLAESVPEQTPTINESQDTSAAVSGQETNALPEKDDSAIGQPSEQVKDEPVETQLENANKDSAAAEGKDDPAEQSAEGFGQDSTNGGFNGMNFVGGDMNQMQMMIAMQNGMNPAAFGSFPMMGMGMGMDPMAMQNMYLSGGFGTQGMGMNGMNMGMNGFGSGNNDWNGQQSWNVGQDNFNPNAAGMGTGDFGNFNSGFRTGYNSANYGHHNQYNDYGRGGYGFRGRGRGRGFYRGYGRGYQQGYNPRHQGHQMWAEQQNFQQFGGGDAQADPNSQNQDEQLGEDKGFANTDEFGRTVRPNADQEGQADEQNGHNSEVGHDENGQQMVESHQSTGQVPSVSASRPGDAHDHTAMYNGDISSDQFAQLGGSLNGTSVMAAPAAANIPFNAPTGPKAMRQGLPNTSALHLRARGFIPDNQSPLSGTNNSLVESPDEEQAPSRSSSRHSRRDRDRHHAGSGRDRDREGEKVREKDYDKDHTRSRSYSRSRSRSSRSRERKESRRHRRHRSESVTDDDCEDEYRRRKHRSKRSTRDDDDDEDYKKRSKDEKYDDRSRPASPDRDHDREREHKRLSHRSHRERDKDRDRDSDKDRRRKSSHRSHRDHDRERERDRDRDRTKDRDKDRARHRDRDRDRDRDREHRHRSRKTSAEPTSVESASKDFNPPTGPRSNSISIKVSSFKGSGFEIKGASNKSNTHDKRESDSSRRASQASISGLKAAPSGPAKDPHTLEREARDRERLLKEAQRMSLAGLKRNRDVGDERSGRRKSRRSEVAHVDEEERMRRLEAEREGDRWD